MNSMEIHKHLAQLYYSLQLLSWMWLSQTLCSQSDHTRAFILKFCKPPYFVKHLIIKISERSFTQCFDDSKFDNLTYTVQGDKM